MSRPIRVSVTYSLDLEGIWEFPDDTDDDTVLEVIDEDLLGFFETAEAEWKVEREDG